MTDAQAPRYSILFEGKLVDGVSRKRALANLAHLTNLSEEELLDGLFSVKPVIAAQADNYQLADQFKDQFRQAGLEVSTQAYHASHDEIINANLTFGHYAPLETQHIEPNFVLRTTTNTSWQDSNTHQAKGKFYVTFTGTLLDGFKRAQVVTNLCSLTNSSEHEVLENIFSAVPIILCQTNNPDLAKTYHQCFEQAGLTVHLLSLQRNGKPEIAARSHLLIRDDKPAALPIKKVQRFTFTLYGLAVLACVCWAVIYMVIDSYLKQELEQTIQVQLVQYKAIEKVPAPAPAKLKKPPTLNKTTAVEKKPTKKSAPKPPVKKQQKPTKPPEKKVVAPVQPKPVKKKTNKKLNKKQQQKFKGEYNLQLLNWFAQFQQDNQLESKYVEGEITLRLTIARNGTIKHIEVLKSSSEELQRIVVMQLRKAKTVPGIPIKITGAEYVFDLPLRYRFD